MRGRSPAAPPAGVLSAAEVAASADWIASVQLPTGMIPWYPGGHADAWNHTEAAMALSLAGRRAEAESAFEWLSATQQADGSWCMYLLAEGVEEPRRDPNVGAYVATGVWWHWRLSGDRGFLETMWPAVCSAMEFALALQAPGGEIRWSRDVDGQVGRFALLTGTSSILRSLRCATWLAAALGEERPAWEAAAARISAAIARHVGASASVGAARFEGGGGFAPKNRWAMDWYYPVLSGAIDTESARARLEKRWETFVLPGRGVRCVSDHEWITVAETAECAMA
ncbi:MAG: prenyltransferase, partial [Acidimicrobiaceae bacterium]|nr:prenyltransferase [Acidimicrobiaceae bacterium]